MVRIGWVTKSEHCLLQRSQQQPQWSAILGLALSYFFTLYVHVLGNNRQLIAQYTTILYLWGLWAETEKELHKQLGGLE